MTVTLWKLHLSRHVAGFVHGPVASVRPAYAGRWSPAERDIVAPDPRAIRDCLPHYYRAAWDRSGGSLWHPDAHVGAARAGSSYAYLHSARGRYMNMLHAFPYLFDPLA